jgi:hypothetical protein
VDQGDNKRYIFFNHIVETDVYLPELLELGEGDAQRICSDVKFQISSDQSELGRSREWSHHWLAPDKSVTLSLAKESDALFLDFPHMARFAICNHGQLVTCYAQKTLSVATIRHLLLDQVLPRLFAHFYSLTVLHASFLSVEGNGVCFLADSGWGKSTMAAGFYGAGHIILTDDCVAVTKKNDQIIGTPAYRGIRLLPDSMENMGDSFVGKGEAVAEYTSKKRIDLKNREVNIFDSVPIKAFFLLTSPKVEAGYPKVKIQTVGGGQAMKELLKNSFCLDVHDGQWQKEHFLRMSGLTSSGLPIYSVSYPREYAMLPEVVNTIIATLDQL